MIKPLLATLVFLTAAVPALAMHAYGEDSCIGYTIDGQVISFKHANGKPADPHRLDLAQMQVDSSDLGSDSLWVNVDQSANSYDEPVATADLVLQNLDTTSTNKKTLDDGCFQGSAQTSLRSYKILQTSDRLNKFLTLQKGEVVHMSCYSDAQYPTGPDCGK